MDRSDVNLAIKVYTEKWGDKHRAKHYVYSNLNDNEDRPSVYAMVLQVIRDDIQPADSIKKVIRKRFHRNIDKVSISAHLEFLYTEGLVRRYNYGKDGITWGGIYEDGDDTR